MMYYGLKVIYWPVLIVMSLLHFPRFSGRENVPAGGAIICPNHSGLADPIWVVLAMHDRKMPFFMAKKQIMDVPVLGGFLRWFGAFPVDRGNADLGAIKRSLTILKSGEKLLMFPEGTRVKKNKKSEPKSGAVLLAHRADVPILPVYITPNRKPFQPIRVIIGEPCKPEFESKRPSNEELDAETQKLMKTIYQLGEKK